ncbi:hypothetical protein ACP4OV_006810 [Aristida adscensionis]
MIGSSTSQQQQAAAVKLEAAAACASCGQPLDSKPDMLRLPAGVKFDPSDQELIDHLHAMVNGRPHPLIHDFIPTLQGQDGICYTHPQKLPGVTRDGLSRHFFHMPSKAYTTGTRKRRKIQADGSDEHAVGTEARWHKTGKTRPVIVGGKHKGCKKILVLYTNYGGKTKNAGKPEKTNWVIHQYHLGCDEEKDGELVVSKVFYQRNTRQSQSQSQSQSLPTAAHKEAAQESSQEDVHVLLPVPASAVGTTATATSVVMMQPSKQQCRPKQAADHFTSALSYKTTSQEASPGDTEVTLPVLAAS